MPPSAEGLEEGPRRKAEDSRGVIEQADPNQCIAFVCTLVAGPYATVCSKREAGDTNKQVEAPAPGFAWHNHIARVRTSVRPCWVNLMQELIMVQCGETGDQTIDDGF